MLKKYFIYSYLGKLYWKNRDHISNRLEHMNQGLGKIWPITDQISKCVLIELLKYCGNPKKVVFMIDLKNKNRK